MSVINQIVDRQHVSASWRGIIRAIRKGLKKTSRIDRSLREDRRRLYIAGWKRHEENRKLYHYVMGGMR